MTNERKPEIFKENLIKFLKSASEASDDIDLLIMLKLIKKAEFSFGNWKGYSAIQIKIKQFDERIYNDIDDKFHAIANSVRMPEWPHKGDDSRLGYYVSFWQQIPDTKQLEEDIREVWNSNYLTALCEFKESNGK